MENKKRGFATRAVHSGKIEDGLGSHKPPIYQTSNFDFPSAEIGAERFAGKDKGYIYTRLGNPTCDALARKVASLEGGVPGKAYASGMGAISAVMLGLLDKGDHIVTSDTLYGCTDSLFRNHLKRFGIGADFVDTRNILDKIKDVLYVHTKAIFIETPTNPTLRITDLKAVAQIAEKNGAYLVVDNTFTTPYLQRPIEFGADVVIHSLTKNLGGHSSLVGGVTVYSEKFAANEENVKRMKRAADDFGANFNPFEAYLALLGIETLQVRMDKKCRTAQAVAEFLESHDKIERVFFPGLESFPQYELAREQMSQPGDMLWFIMKGGYEAGKKLMDGVEVCSDAVSLGSTATLIQHPASMTHRITPKEEREKIGIVDGGIRLAIGLEDQEDIIADLEHALEKV